MNTTIASSITKAASRQTYYTVRFLVDRERVEDAYRAYGYFRWLDDLLDADSGSEAERWDLLARQKALLEAICRGEVRQVECIEENMLAELVRHDEGAHSGLQLYLRNMMQVMEFDARRRGRLVSQSELNEYTRWLATAVTECIHHFIGHESYSPQDSSRYLAVSAAHVAHMLRDTYDDARLGYYNIPREVLDRNHIGPLDCDAGPYRAWVRGRVLQAREHFRAGKAYFRRVESARCRLACFAYIARFEWLLDTIEREGYCLRPQYNERKSAGTALRMSWLTLASMLHPRGPEGITRPVSPRSPGHL